MRIARALLLTAIFATPALGQTVEPTQGSIESEVETIKTENAALREQIRKILAALPSAPPADAPPPPPPQGASQTTEERFKDGMIIWQTAKDAAVPFLLKFN